MPACAHTAFDAVVAIEPTELGHLATVEIKCRLCGEPMRFVGLEVGRDDREPTCSADHTAARLPLAPAYSPTVGELLRCPECEHILAGPLVDRPSAIESIDCGPEHLIAYSDGVRVLVGADGVRVLDDPVDS